MWTALAKRLFVAIKRTVYVTFKPSSSGAASDRRTLVLPFLEGDEDVGPDTISFDMMSQWRGHQSGARKNVTSTVSADVADHLFEVAKRLGVSVSALLAPVITEFAATV